LSASLSDHVIDLRGLEEFPAPTASFVFPAIAEGPFRAIQSVPGVGVAVLLNVSLGERPLEVRLSKQSGRVVAQPG